MFSKIEQLFDNLFMKVHPVPPGIFYYQSPEGAPNQYKWHLRIESDGSGLMVINASTVLHLNQTAAEYAYYLAEGKNKPEIAKLISDRYDIDILQAEQDLEDFTSRIIQLVNSEDLDPVTFLDMERVAPHSRKLSAPLRIDCALTYAVSPGIESAAAPNERVTKELTTEEWKRVLEIIWKAGVPHVVFTGGEPTLRPDLPDLIRETERIGLVSGLLTDGIKLGDEDYLKSILNAGLDHIMLLADDSSSAFWKALNLLMPEDIAVTVHVTVTQKNKQTISEFLQKLSDAGVTSISLSAESETLAPQLASAGQNTASLGMHLVWDLPVPYSSCNPFALEQQKTGDKRFEEGAGKVWLYIEPDGDVLPAQGIDIVKGNILVDSWQKIWSRR
jgi:organic radical activating enzyme